MKIPSWTQGEAIFFALVLLTHIEHATGAALDNSFDVGLRADADILALAVQDDGKIIAVGEFSLFGGTNHNHVVRLNPDGSIDPSFATGTGASGTVRAVAIQSDGKIVVGGDFWTFNGLDHHYLARLNPDGSVDKSFDANRANLGSVNFYGSLRALAIQPDGQILFGGTFADSGSLNRVRIDRLHTDGSLDTSFNPGTGANDYPRSIAVQPDGKILVGGRFTSFNDAPAGRIVRLLANGSVDPSFNPGQGADDHIRALALDSSGRIYIGGDFEMFNGTNRSGVARLHPNGGLDLSFDQGDPDNDTINTLAVGPDGKVWIGGLFQEAGGQPRALLARLNENGAADPLVNVAFDNRAGDEMYALKFQRDGLLLMAGEFRSVSGVTKQRLARVVPPEVPATIRFGSPSIASGLEGSNVTFTIERLGPTNSGASVAFATQNGSAIAGADFAPTNGMMLFAPGEVRKTVTVSLGTDLVFDPDEEFRLVLSNPQGAMLGAPASVTARIVENSPKIEMVTLYNYQFYEGASSDSTNAAVAFVQLQRFGYVWGQPWNVNYEIIPGTATHEQDFTGALQGTVDFTIGNDFRSIQIPLVNDGRSEPTETFTVRLTGAVGAVITTSNVATVTILDDDDPIEWAASQWQASETSGTTEVVIRRNDNGPETVSVGYTITGNTASSDDFVPLQGTVTFAPLEKTKALTVTILDDCRIEPDESVSLALTAATGGAGLGVNSNSRLIIQDNERPGSFDLTFGSNGLLAISSGPLAPHTGGALLTGSTAPGGKVIRLLRDGTVDSSFHGTNFMPPVLRLGTQWPFQQGIVESLMTWPDGRFLVRGRTETILFPGGNFETNHLFRLLADGRVDSSFTTDTRVVLTRGQSFLQPALEDKVLVAGSAISASGEIIASDLVRLHGDGSLDTAFHASLGPPLLNSLRVRNFVSLPDGRILVSGWFEFAGTNFSGVVRLLPNGEMDAEFTPSLCLYTPTLAVAYGSPPAAIIPQSDGRILLGGAFSRVNNSMRRGLARLQPDGQLDGTFDPVASLPDEFYTDVTAMALDDRGRILIGGTLASVFNWPGRVARLLPDGHGDFTFEMNEPTPLYDPTQILVGSDDKAVVATYSGIFRLNGDAMPEITLIADQSGTKWHLSTPAITGDTYRLQATRDFLGWDTLQTQTSVGCSVEFVVGSTLPPQFYRIERVLPP